MAVNKVVQSNGTTLIDITPTTAVASDVAIGKIFFLADGTQATGTASGGGSVPTYETYFDDSITAASDKTISIPSLSSLYFSAGETWRVTWDGTEYTCYPNVHEGWLWYIGNHGLTDGTDDGTGEPFCLYNYGGGALNGMARTVGTHTLKLEKQTSSGGGGSSSAWTKVAETSYQVSTTSTSAATVDTWATGHSELWTSDKWVYVRIRDTAGKRNGYFYGTDTFFANYTRKNNPSNTGVSESLGMIRNIYSVTAGGAYGWRFGYSTTGYGVYADCVYDDGRVRIQSRYNSSYSRTINGTYKVEVYLLNPPTGTSIFE